MFQGGRVMRFGVFLSALLGLAACGQPPVPLAGLPAGVATTAFSFTDDSFLRGVAGSANTVPAGRPSAILDVTYQMACQTDGLADRRAQAERLLDEAYVVADLYSINRRELTGWTTDASAKVRPAGCVVNTITYTTRTTDPVEVGRYMLANVTRL